MRKSAIMKVSNAPLFRKIEGSLLYYRRVFSVEARLIIKETNEKIYENPKAKNYRIYLKLAEEAVQREEFKEALPNINQCLTLLEKTSDSVNNLDRAQIYKLAAQVYKENYQLQDSICFYKRSLEIVEIFLGKDNIYLPSIVYGLANSYHENYMSNEAIFYFKKFLSIQSIKQSNNIESKIDVIIQIASSCNNILGLKHSIKLLKQSLRLSKEYLNQDHIFYFRILWLIAQTYLDAHKKDKAKKYYKKCLDILRNAHARKQLSKEEIYEFLIEYYRAIEMPDRSLYLAKRAIKYLKGLKEDKSLSIARKYRELSHIYKEENENEKEFYYLSKHLIILKKVKGLKNPEFLLSLLEYFNFLTTRCLNKTALERIRNIPKEFKDVLNSNKTFRIYYKLIKQFIYSNLEMTKKSSKKLKELKILIIEIYGKIHPIYLHYKLQKGRNLLQRGHYNEALAVSENGFARSQKFYPYYSIYSSHFLSQIAEIYHSKVEIAQSLEYYKRFFDVCKELGLENTYRVKKYLLNVAALHFRQDNKQLVFYFLRKSMDLKITDEMQNIYYYHSFFDTTAGYYFEFANFEVSKRLSIKQLKIVTSSDEYICSRAIPILFNIALCDINLKNYLNLNQLYKMCYKLNEESVKEEEIKQTNKCIPKMLLIKAYFYFHHLKNYEECLSILRTALCVQLKFNHKNDIQMMNIYMIIAEVYFEVGKYIESLQLNKRMLKIIEKTNKNMFYSSFIHQRIGIIYFSLECFDETRKYFRRRVQLCKKSFNTNNEGIKKIYHSIALSYIGQRKLDAAFKYLNKCLVNSTISKNMSLTDTCILNSIGYAYVLKDNSLLNNAFKIFNICLEAAKESSFDSKYTEIFINNLAETKRSAELVKNYRDQNNPSPTSSNILINLNIACPP